jgi:hypothetical protein
LAYNGTNWVNEVPATITPGDLPAGSVLQVVSVVKTDTFTTTSSSLVDITGLSVSITPSSTSSKILVLASVPFSNTATSGSRTVALQLLRQTTEIYKSETSGSRESGSAVRGPSSIVDMELGSFSFLDSPSSETPLTYKFKIKTIGGTAVVGRLGNDPSTVDGVRVPSSITLMEVAG